MRSALWISLSVGLLGLATGVHAATLYVNNTGSPSCSDGTAKASNTANAPWCTIQRAAKGHANPATPNASEAASAGDLVLVTAGTYTESGTITGSCGSTGRYTAILDPVNSGTTGNPITFRGVGTVAVRATDNHYGPILGWLNHDYIVWDHFYVDEQYLHTCDDTGSVVLWGGTGGQLINSTIIGDSQWTADNHNGIRTEYCDTCTIKNNSISNVWDSGGTNRNAAGIMTYSTTNIVIEHNDITDTVTGIYLKHNISPYGGAIVRFNVVRNALMTGMEIHRQDGADVYQNIVRTEYTGGADTYGILLLHFDATTSPDNIDVVNNTIDGWDTGFGAGLTNGGTGNRFYNNIVTYNGVGIGGDPLSGWSDNAVLDLEHNLYYGNTNISYIGSTLRNLATYQSATGQDAVSPAASGSDPLFVDRTAANFRLQGSSPAAALGVDILDLDGDASTSDSIPAGAYITGTETIGLEVASGSTVISGGMSWSGGVRIQ